MNESNGFFKLGLRVGDKGFYGPATIVATGVKLFRGSEEVEAAYALLDEVVIEQINDPLLAKITGETTVAIDKLIVTKVNFTAGTWVVLPDCEQDGEWTADLIRDSMKLAAETRS